MVPRKAINESTVQRRYRLFIMFECAFLAYTIHAVFFNSYNPIIGLLAFWHLIAVPICVMYLVGNPIVLSLEPFILSRESRALRRRIRRRPVRSDDEFYNRYYAGTDVPREIPVRLRRWIRNHYALGDRIVPTDRLQSIADDVDFFDVFFCIEREFGIRLTKDVHHLFDGTFESLVGMIQSKLLESQG